MNRKLSYDGKELHEMIPEELRLQLVVNKERIARNNLFITLITGVSLFACLLVALLTLGGGVIDSNFQNNWKNVVIYVIIISRNYKFERR